MIIGQVICENKINLIGRIKKKLYKEASFIQDRIGSFARQSCMRNKKESIEQKLYCVDAHVAIQNHHHYLMDKSILFFSHTAIESVFHTFVAIFRDASANLPPCLNE